MTASLHIWLYFHAALFVLLAVEFIVARFMLRDTRTKAVFATLLWVTAALAFALVVRHLYGPFGATQYLAGYALEQSLSADNLFVFLLLFGFFGIPVASQPRVLFWGVAGAMLMRAAFVLADVALLDRFEWVGYLFAAFLTVAAIRLLLPHTQGPAATPPRWFQWVTRLRPVSTRTDVFFTREATAPGTIPRRMMTVLFLALIAIEITDVLFALDSIPAVLSITRVPFIAYASNILAVMCLRSLYVLLAAALSRLRFLHYGLALILLFAAAKMLAAPWLSVGPLLSLAIIAALLAITIALSLAMPRPQPAMLDTSA